MPEDKLIKSGQITLPRVLFLAACGAVLVVIVAGGYLKWGYLLLTAVLCVLLGVIAADYGVKMDHVDLDSPLAGTPQSGAAVPMNAATTAVASNRSAAEAAEPVRMKKKAGRPAKRRR